jgi:excisionase family DNA binding protein
MAPNIHQTDTISVPEAAKVSGLGESTIRRLIEAHEINATRDSRKRVWISRESLMGHLATSTKAQRGGGVPTQIRSSTTKVTPNDAVAASLEAQVSILKESVSHERELNRELRERVRILEGQLTQHMAEMRALLSGKSEGLLSLKKWFGK